MAASEERFRVPAALRARVREIVELTDAMCADRLDSEYAELCRRLVAKLARKRSSPIERGETRVWAAGAIYAIGQNNFLFDATQTPHLAADELSNLVGVPKSTMAAKAKRIRDAVRLDAPMDPEFCRAELLADHPLAWLVEVNGLIVDARMLPIELQTEAQRLGLIPNLPLGQAA
ncbi:MAG: DUF6398 domain-containing protein [Solirubrobacteraceae bacterium]